MDGHWPAGPASKFNSRVFAVFAGSPINCRAEEEVGAAKEYQEQDPEARSNSLPKNGDGTLWAG